MAHKRLIPERTVDSLFAAEAVHHIPTAIIWSPSNTAHAWDHELIMHSDVAIFEAKAVISDKHANPLALWSAPIDIPQLDHYLQHSTSVLYLLMAKPERPDMPWIRECQLGTCSAYAHCQCCEQVWWPKRRWGGSSPHIANAPRHLRLQPWACHWTWVITAVELRAFTSQYGRGAEVLIPADDMTLGAIPSAVRLCHWLESASEFISGQRRQRPTGLLAGRESGELLYAQLDSLLQFRVDDPDATSPQMGAFGV